MLGSRLVLLSILLGGTASSFGAITFVPEMGDVYPDQFGRNPLAMTRINSEFELRSATARLGTQEVSLTFSTVFSDWRAAEAFNITNTPSGTNVIAFEATDVFGNAASTNVAIRIDRMPVLEVRSPVNGALARPLIHVFATAEDDLGESVIRITAGFPGYVDYTRRVDDMLDLSAAEESLVQMNFFAYDATRGGYTLDYRYVLSLSNPRYQPVLMGEGEIIDANSQAALFLRTNGILSRIERSSRRKTILKTNFVGTFPRQALLTPSGALVHHVSHSESGEVNVLELNEGEEINLGVRNPFGPLVVAGRYGLFQANGAARLRDFVAKTNFALTPYTFVEADVAENGTAVFTTPFGTLDDGNAVVLYRDGTLTELTTETNDFRHYPRTDGTNVLWYSTDYHNLPHTRWTIHLMTPEGTTNLVEGLGFPADFVTGSGLQSAMNGGWTAFPKLGAQGQQQIWLRSPEGDITQATFYSRTAHLKALGADGSLIVTLEVEGGERQVDYIPQGGAPKKIGKDFLATYFANGTNFSAYAHGTLFEMIVEGEPIGLTSTQYDPESGQMSYYVTSTAPASFTLQRSTNFVDWTAVERQSVTNTAPTRFEVETEPGFFRVRRL